MIRIQNRCGKVIQMCLIPIFVGVIMMALSALRPLLRVLAPINEVKEVLVHIRFMSVHCYQECA